MKWQDIVFTVGSIGFIIALIPTVLAYEKPAILTSVWTGVTLLVFSVVYLTLDLYMSATVTCITAFTWLLLAWQKFSQNRQEIVDVKIWLNEPVEILLPPRTGDTEL